MSVSTKRAVLLALAAAAAFPALAQEQAAPRIPAVSPPAYMYRTSVFFDWFGTAYEGGGAFLNQLGTRIKFEMAKGPSRDWVLLIDVRDRHNLAEGSANQLLLYNVRFTFDSPNSPVYVSAGQMNLYDSAGIGQLLGAVAGFKWKSSFLAGGYAGLEQDLYVRKFDTSYFKYGAFARYTGPKALSLSLSFNQLRYSGAIERSYLYAQALVPVRRTLYIFGNMEYELGKGIRPSDRLSRLFLNARLDLARYVDVTGFYSSGRGLDFHSYILDRSQDPSLQDRDLARFFYSEQYGARAAFKPVKNLRLHVSRQESRQKDLDISNHTWRLGASVTDIMKSGLSAYGDYSFNRGSRSESDSYYLSLSRTFGRASCNVSFANTYNGLRILPSSGEPEIIHLDGYKTISGNVFVPLSRRLSISAEYSYFLQKNANEHQFFIRLLFRK